MKNAEPFFPFSSQYFTTCYGQMTNVVYSNDIVLSCCHVAPQRAFVRREPLLPLLQPVLQLLQHVTHHARLDGTGLCCNSCTSAGICRRRCPSSSSSASISPVTARNISCTPQWICHCFSCTSAGACRLRTPSIPSPASVSPVTARNKSCTSL